jgi:hypothetical protein
MNTFERGGDGGVGDAITHLLSYTSLTTLYYIMNTFETTFHYILTGHDLHYSREFITRRFIYDFLYFQSLSVVFVTLHDST